MNPLSSEALDYFYSSVQTTPAHTLRETFHMCTRPEFLDRLDATTARTLMVTGTHDPLLALDYVREHIVHRIPSEPTREAAFAVVIGHQRLLMSRP